ncbi:MAG: hypothetical protein PSX80_08870 [bacterium]|nr:hypothetical protein [bacterium]
MQQDKTPMPDVDDLDQDYDPGASKDVPLPPDVEDRNAIEEPDPTPPAVKDPNTAPKQIVTRSNN